MKSLKVPWNFSDYLLSISTVIVLSMANKLSDKMKVYGKWCF